MDKFAIRSRLTAEMRKAIEGEVDKFRESVRPSPSRSALVRKFRENMQQAFLSKIEEPVAADHPTQATT